MKFIVFKWWESWIKLIIYVFILAATAGLIIGYCCVKDEGGTVAFAVSISYALVLFLITIPLSKIDRYIAEKLYERESFYLTFKRLRDITNSTIKNSDENDLDGLKNHILDFQIFTGREAHMLEEKLQGKKVPVLVREKGFTYSSDMQELETRFLKIYEANGNKKELSKIAKKLCKCYKKSCQKLDSNYNRIARIYGGALFDLIERDTTATDTEYSLSDIVSKIDDLSMELSSLRSDMEDLSSEFNGNQRDVRNDHKMLAEKLMDIEDEVMELRDGNDSK